MSIRTTLSAAAVVLGALLLVALAPTGAAAHGAHAGHTHASPVPAKPESGAPALHDKGVARGAALSAEVRTHAPMPAGHQADADCGDRGCCSNGHCSGCGTAIAPSAWTCSRLAANIVLLNPNASPPAGLVREGPPRPPKSIA